ncbi:MAG: hypothetical protein H0V39_00055 [Nitrosomonas sp.]|nr:hypothetical protein [Nitrosomonas sp.]
MTLFADGALFLSLLFGWFYLWIVAPLWQAPETTPLAWFSLLISGGLLTGSTIWFNIVTRQIRRDQYTHLQIQLWGIAGIGLVHCGILIWAWLASKLAVTLSAHDAIIEVMLMYLLFHSALAVIMTALQAWRVSYGYVGKDAPYELIVVKPWWWYTTIVFWVSFLAMIILPSVWGNT